MDFLVYIARFAVLLFILPAHEFAHAYAAYKNGDDTARLYGRYTLNPMKHFDPIGLICFLVAGFGWAKPVPVNPYNFRNLKKGSFWVAVAGILTNYALAFLFYPLMYLTNRFLPITNYFTAFIYLVFYMGFALDLSFCVFNLIPVFPLDGFRIVDTFVSKRNKVYQVLRSYGYYILLGLIILSSIANRIPQLEVLDIFGKFMSFAVDKFGYPIKLFWNYIFSLIFG